ncbi:MAG: hypothetical protein E5V24_08040 [Mesorhizobium sp.]|nr:MAG: hypothetical protein E5V24_08040 [Mesorhizobium sp.]
MPGTLLGAARAALKKMVGPAARREAVAHLQAAIGLSARGRTRRSAIGRRRPSPRHSPQEDAALFGGSASSPVARAAPYGVSPTAEALIATG